MFTFIISVVIVVLLMFSFFRRSQTSSSTVEANMKLFFGVLFVLVAYAVILTVPLWLLWNWLVPTIFGLPEITLLQSLGLMFLFSIVFNNSRSSSE